MAAPQSVPVVSHLGMLFNARHIGMGYKDESNGFVPSSSSLSSGGDRETSSLGPQFEGRSLKEELPLRAPSRTP